MACRACSAGGRGGSDDTEALEGTAADGGCTPPGFACAATLVERSRWLTAEVGVAAIPLAAFYKGGFEQRFARFCFAKKDETLQLALDRLAKL